MTTHDTNIRMLSDYMKSEIECIHDFESNDRARQRCYGAFQLFRAMRLVSCVDEMERVSVDAELCDWYNNEWQRLWDAEMIGS